MFLQTCRKPTKRYVDEKVRQLTPHQISEIRLATGLTLKQMADYLSVSYTHYQRIEQGISFPGAFVLQALHSIKKNGIV